MLYIDACNLYNYELEILIGRIKKLHLNIISDIEQYISEFSLCLDFIGSILNRGNLMGHLLSNICDLGQI